MDYKPKEFRRFQQGRKIIVSSLKRAWNPGCPSGTGEKVFDGGVDGDLPAQMSASMSMASAAAQRNNTQLSLMLPFFSIAEGTNRNVPVDENIEAIVARGQGGEEGGSASAAVFFPGIVWRDGKLTTVLADRRPAQRVQEHLEYLLRERSCFEKS